MKLHTNRSVPIGGDPADLICLECDSLNTIFEEYIELSSLDESGLGILCLDCNHLETPDQLSLRFEPSDEED